MIDTPHRSAPGVNSPCRGYRRGCGSAGSRSADRRPGRRTRPCPSIPASLLGRSPRPGVADSAIQTRAVCPTTDACADRAGSQTDARTCRVSTTSPIGRADRDRLTGVAGQAVEHAVDGRADGVVVEMRLGERDQPFGHLDLGLGFGDRLGARADHHAAELGLGRLLLEPGLVTARSASKTCCSETSCRASKRPEPRRQPPGPARPPPWPARPPARLTAAPRAVEPT